MRIRLALLCLLLPLGAWLALPMMSSGAESPQAKASKLDRKIGATRQKIGKRKGTERVLSSEIQTYSRRIDRLQGRIETLAQRQQRVQADLDRKQAELARLRGELRAERARLVRLRARLIEARTKLEERLVELYQAEKPDLVTVVLNANGFADLLERGEFLKRINDQDKYVVRIVKTAKAESTRTEKELDRLEARQATVTKTVQQRRDEVAAIKQDLIGTRVGYEGTKADKAAALTKVRSERRELEEDLEAMEAQSRKIAASLRAAQGGGGGSPTGGPIAKGTGVLGNPTNGAFTSPFGMRWGRLHAGIDVGAPEGTPIYAADSGTVILMQGVGASGGYGNYTCIGHGSSLSTCYAHQSRFATSQGARVRKGQLIGYVGNTGRSFGAHLHFEVRVNGVPQDPMRYL